MKEFKHAVGYEEVKEELIEIIDILDNPTRYTNKGVRLPKGMILVGSPGNGKTILAREMLEMTNREVFVLNDFINQNESSINTIVKEVFDKARLNSPSIILIDEFDKIFKSTKDDYKKQRAIQSILIELDGLKENNQVFILALANDLAVIDDVLLRSGRFDRVINIRYPDQNNRQKLLEYYIEKHRLDISESMDELINMTRFMSCAEISNFINESALLSIRLNQKTLELKTLHEALDRVKMKNIRTQDKYSDDDKKRFAVHEIGHALVVYHCKYHSLEKVTLHQRGNSGGQTFHRSNENGYRSKNNYIESMKINLAGFIAEELIYDNPSNLAISDIKMFRRILNQIFDEYGLMGIEHLGVASRYGILTSEDRKLKKDQVEVELMNKLYDEVRVLLNENIHLIELLSSKLVEKSIIFKEEFNNYINNYHLTLNKHSDNKIMCIQA